MNFSDDNLFWNTINQLISDHSDHRHAELHSSTDQHAEFHEECINNQEWIQCELTFDSTMGDANSYTKEFNTYHGTKQLHQNYMKIVDGKRTWNRYYTIPDHDRFPKLMKFMEDTPEFVSPVVAKLGAGERIYVHDHKGKGPPYIYNMSINYPRGCKFAIYPDGIINYCAGDIYRLYIHNSHAVRNYTDTDRYHVMFRPRRWKRTTSDLRESSSHST